MVRCDSVRRETLQMRQRRVSDRFAPIGDLDTARRGFINRSRVTFARLTRTRSAGDHPARRHGAQRHGHEHYTPTTHITVSLLCLPGTPSYVVAR